MQSDDQIIWMQTFEFEQFGCKPSNATVNHNRISQSYNPMDKPDSSPVCGTVYAILFDKYSADEYRYRAFSKADSCHDHILAKILGFLTCFTNDSSSADRALIESAIEILHF